MIAISYAQLLTFISIIWILARLAAWIKNKRISLGRECVLLLVYVCIVVVARFTFFPFSLVDGQIQPLIFDAVKALPPRVNFVPFVFLFDYPEMREVLLNLIGNIAMFIPLGIVWPSVFRTLDTHKKAIFAGVGFSLLIEILSCRFLTECPISTISF
jgi:glycopeptide antibiotics resistance protein